MSQKIHYKDVMVPAILNHLINHMPDVESYREELRTLGGQWDLLTILGQMSGTGMDMSETRRGFQHLTSELLGQLGLEILTKTIREIAGKAQVTVDIVIRNLFERTADIGFLATDDDVRSYLKHQQQQAGILVSSSDAATFSTELPVDCGNPQQLRDRFREYVAKYSVYFNIILLDPAGRVLVQLDTDNQVEHSDDPLINEALTTSEEYVEVYRHSDLIPDQEQSLIYAYRVTATNDPKSTPLGVLCLCFRFDDEMQGIFHNLRKEDDWSVLTLLDGSGKVIASSDTYQIPIGLTLDFDLDKEFTRSRFAGREYLTKTCATKGYQGFFGLGWYGHVMIPLEHAFDKETDLDLGDSIDDATFEAIMKDSQLFSENLRSIPMQADQIQNELERTVWNGNVRESDAQSKVLLWNISDAGSRTKRVFEESIGNLQGTVVRALLDQVEFQASLAVDIMDRNLYERANDCRWWALTSDFRRLLAQPSIGPENTANMAKILTYINNLYTVYTNLFVYDKQGRILAVSNPDQKHLVGTRLTDSWVQKTLNLKDSQSFSVSEFAKTNLYHNEATYIYGAAITDLDNPRQILGGIGIVFDSTPQFNAMLEDSLLNDETGQPVSGCFGLFTNMNGQVISSTSKDFPIGSNVPLDSGYLNTQEHGRAGIIELEGNYYALGVAASSGYREYKTSDGYKNDILSMIFMPLAKASSQQAVRQSETDMHHNLGNMRDTGEVVELATFYLGPQWFGVRAEKVCEAIFCEKITRIPESPKGILGEVMFADRLITVIDLRNQLPGYSETAKDANNLPIVIIKTNRDHIGIVVDSLGPIPAVSSQRMDPIAILQEGKTQYIECLVKPNADSKEQKVLLVIDPEKLINSLVKPADLVA